MTLALSLRRWTLLAWALLAGPVWAGPWEVRSPQGLQVRIEQDSYRTREGYVLARRYPDGTLDAQFGEQGSKVFSLGPDNEGPAALRADSLGRLWVAGASLAEGDRLHAVVLRFSALGHTDRDYAQAGRSAVQPGGRAARALDLLPQADGSAYVAGIVTDANGVERSGWWRLRPDGSVDPAFGLGGLWVDTGGQSSEVLGLVPGADGSVSLQLRRGTAADASVETWTLAPGVWQPVRAGAAAAPAAPAALASAPQPDSFNRGGDPFGTVEPRLPAASVPQASRPTSENRAWGLLGLVLVLGLAWLFWRRRR